jgi:hypothetical protein
MVGADFVYIRDYGRVGGGIELWQLRVGLDRCNNRRFTSV